ncbi:hypothetical protein Ddc_03959 [Ditylenchus destructor]|nr:hypothetical protein Ddc_03959 [Ditylenchus destructor]
MTYHCVVKSTCVVFLLMILFANSANADWWDDFVSNVHEKVVGGADWLKDEAGPGIREKFDSAKEKLQDPETHEQVQQFIKEKAIPVLEEKWQQFKTFINDDVAPEVQKIYEAGVEASERQKAKNGEKSGEKKDE